MNPYRLQEMTAYDALVATALALAYMVFCL